MLPLAEAVTLPVATGVTLADTLSEFVAVEEPLAAADCSNG
jgi:hypothetical protein